MPEKTGDHRWQYATVPQTPTNKIEYEKEKEGWVSGVYVELVK